MATVEREKEKKTFNRKNSPADPDSLLPSASGKIERGNLGETAEGKKRGEERTRERSRHTAGSYVETLKNRKRVGEGVRRWHLVSTRLMFFSQTTLLLVGEKLCMLFI